MKQFMQSGKLIVFILVLILSTELILAQNPLLIPPTLTGTTFNLNVQAGTQNFYTPSSTPTYGINGPFLSPTIIVNKGDIVTLNVINNLPVSTTMHWHGLHVAPQNDGGPHQSIAPGTTWSPSFEILNNAGTFWYHPHGEGKTELHVAKGLAGLFIIHDPAELALGLPQTYGLDDIPIITQTKAFDVLQQIAIADHMDTAVFVNGTLDSYLDLPAQVIRFRLLNGSSMRTFNYGFSNNMTFYQIATDGGLVETPVPLTRLLLAPGERAEILVDLNGMNGQSVQLMSYASEMPNGIFGAPAVGTIPDVIDMYDDNPLNGADFELLQMNVIAQSGTPITTIPSTLVPYIPYDEIDATVNRTLVFDTIRLLPGDVPNRAEGPFGFNNETFNMDSINEIVRLDAQEIWTLKNNTLIAHPFHIHDIQFNIIEKNGTVPPLNEQGWKDVVLVMPEDSVKFITKFTTFTDDMVPYMYHCHLLHHEDDGMMGAFLVVNPDWGIEENETVSDLISVSPNPTTGIWNIKTKGLENEFFVSLNSISGDLVFEKTFTKIQQDDSFEISSEGLENGVYFLKIQDQNREIQVKLVKGN